MTTANDSHVSGSTTFATHLKGSKEYPVGMMADKSGHILGTVPTWVAAAKGLTNVAAARTTHLDLFNATGSGVVLSVHGIFIIPSLVAVTGVGLTWEIIRTSAEGTGGTTVTPYPMDTANTSLPAGVTCRSKPTGGATTNYVLLYPNTSSEETSPYAGMASTLNHLGVIGDPVLQEVVLREGEGIKIDQTTNSSVGTTTLVVVFTVE